MLLYNATANAWNPQFTNMDVAIIGFPMINLLERPYVFGGWNAYAQNSVHTVDLIKNVWSWRAAMCRPNHTSLILDRDSSPGKWKRKGEKENGMGNAALIGKVSSGVVG